MHKPLTILCTHLILLAHSHITTTQTTIRQKFNLLENHLDQPTQSNFFLMKPFENLFISHNSMMF